MKDSKTLNVRLEETGSIIVLHGSCHVEEKGISFFLWSETTETKIKNPAIHPFSGTSKVAVNAVKKIWGNKINFKNETLSAVFPTSLDQPLVSGELSGIVSNENENDTFSYMEWHINGISVNITDVFLMLLQLNNNIINGIIIGDDLKFWKLAASSAFNLLTQQKFIPSATEEGTTIKSRWLPILETYEDQSLIYELSKNMPGVCLAFNHMEIDRETMLRMFISEVIDSISRRFAYNPGKPVKGSVGDAAKWVNSLSLDNPFVTYGRSLAMQKLVSWSEKIKSTLNFPFRTCMDLIPPENNGQWFLKFFLQSKKDPSLMVPYGKIWDRKDSETISLINKYTAFPEEFLLRSIGIAQSIFSPIGKNITSKPDGVYLSDEEVFDLLKTYSSSMEEAGFGILFPEWWGKKENKLGIKIKVKAGDINNSVKLGINALLDYSLDIVLNGEPVSKSDLEKLAIMKSHLVQIGKKWVEIDNDQLNKILKLLDKGNKKMSLPELLTMENSNSIPVVEISGEGWVGDIISGNAKTLPIDEPENFIGNLRAYQKHGVAWLKFMTGAGFGCCLADDMGLGKTIEIIAFLLDRLENNGSTSLILCPTSVISNWEHEIHKFAPSLNVYIHHGNSRKKDDNFIDNITDYKIVLTSYSLLQRDIKFLSQVNWDGIIADEAQYIKNYSTKQSRAIRSLQGNFKIALTGTPIENRLQDLRSIFEFINPGYLSGEKKFRETFSIPIERYGDENAMNALNTLVNPMILRRVKTDKSIIQDLPDKEEVKVYIPLTGEQASLYEAAVNTMLESVNTKKGIERKSVILSTITKLKRLLDHPSLVSGDLDRRLDRSEKLVRLREMLEEAIDSNQKTLVFTQYTDAGKIIKEEMLKKLGEEALYLNGSTPMSLRQNMVERFQDPDGPKIFIISVKAGGAGINLTAATNVIHFDRWWNPSVEDQATDRAYRIGQMKNVHVYKFISTGTIEEKIDDIIEGKSMLREKIIGASDESWITGLSSTDLKNVFSLRREVIASEDDE
ncbi:DEAD/DEAH box helicase [Ferroplasma acidarmanus]|jgi:SNF2 family DNA or RNA helicase|uniref:Helicase n=1 Tax=Ferroplasma acidarmanus Fer1 TaxID=333146 RepID=S0ALY7_FERAC|nr:DEAD/DEAH box helicase [Ferroplasma acidarmanus]AGO60021.1 hypothetical protein FACI_IFERC00001G0041 [Ferroplasma acidarmanus Fer1]